MSIEEVYCSDKARTLSSMKDLCRFALQNCSKHKGCICTPLVNIEPNSVVLDELHLMLHIGDVLIRNLILFAHSQDHYSQERLGERTHHIQELQKAISSCGVSFHIWQNENQPVNPFQAAMTGQH